MNLFHILFFAAGCVAGWQWQRHQQRTERNIVTALEALTESANNQSVTMTDLAKAVDDVLAHVASPGATDQQLAAIKTIVDSNTESAAGDAARLRAAITPEPPTPTPNP